ncbi:MAG: hypothetical protein GF398_03485 [Chitinivibrionales bacterium]|nr:hypothetical protein [Chitinivibrionales bacterium]
MRFYYLKAISILAIFLSGCIENPYLDRVSERHKWLPHAPSATGTAFTVNGIQQWYIIGNDLTAGDDSLHVSVKAPDTTGSIDIWIDSTWHGEMSMLGDSFVAGIALESIAAGEYRLRLNANEDDTAFAEFTFKRSHPLYVVVSNDWDHPHIDDGSFETNFLRAFELHSDFPEAKITHFVAPYAFTDTAISAQRKDWFEQKLIDLRDTHGDELGLHLHMYCHFVEYAGVRCTTDTNFEASDRPLPGYLMPSYLYTTKQYSRLLQVSDSVFAACGLGKPTSFRAGGFWADSSTLQALVQHQFVVDASAANWNRLFGDELVIDPVDVRNKEWFMSTWYALGDESSPYYPSSSDISVSGFPSMPILEVPANALLVDFLDADAMKAVLETIWKDNAVLSEPKHFSIGYHPGSFDAQNYFEMQKMMLYIEHFLAAEDTGVLIYAHMSDLVKVWK